MEGNRREMPIQCGRKETAWWLALANRVFLCATVFFCVIALLAAEDRMLASGSGFGYAAMLLGAAAIAAEFWIALYATRDILLCNSRHWIGAIAKLLAGMSLYLTMPVLTAAAGAHLSAAMATACYTLAFLGGAVFATLFSVVSYGVGEFCATEHAQEAQLNAGNMPYALTARAINRQTRTIPTICTLLVAGTLHLTRGIYSLINRVIAHNDFMRHSFTGCEAVRTYHSLDIWESFVGVLLLALCAVLFLALFLRVKGMDFGVTLERAVRIALPVLSAVHIMKLISVYVTDIYFGAGSVYDAAMKQVMTIYVLGLIVLTVFLAFSAKRTWMKCDVQTDGTLCAEA